MPNALISIQGTLIRGYRVASQASRDYPYGTIDKQKPLFKERGLDLDRFYSGTLNISIAPASFSMIAPKYTFRQVEWTDLHPPEDFSFSPCRVVFQGEEYEGIVYYPHPETKKRHFEDATLMEVISERIPLLRYGDQVELRLSGDEIHIHNAK